MNDDLISREALIKAIEKAQFEGSGYIMAIVDDMPSVQNEPVCIAKVTFDEAKLKELTDKIAEQMRSGEIVLVTEPQTKKGIWINHRNDYGHNIADCSECGKTTQWHDEDEDGIPRYCWYCGAKMEDEADELPH